jgi:hypothetical protein
LATLITVLAYLYASLSLPHTTQARSIVSTSNTTHPSEPSILSENPKHHPKMQYNGPTFHRPPTVLELRYPMGVVVERTLRVWAQSRWRGSVELARDFLTTGYAHLPRILPVMFHLDEVRDGVALKLLMVTFTNPFDAYALLGEVFWCGCESIFFTTYNIFTNYESIFPTANQMHCLPYEK